MNGHTCSWGIAIEYCTWRFRVRAAVATGAAPAAHDQVQHSCGIFLQCVWPRPDTTNTLTQNIYHGFLSLGGTAVYELNHMALEPGALKKRAYTSTGYTYSTTSDRRSGPSMCAPVEAVPAPWVYCPFRSNPTLQRTCWKVLGTSINP